MFSDLNMAGKPVVLYFSPDAMALMSWVRIPKSNGR
jgi:hypothetical protein